MERSAPELRPEAAGRELRSARGCRNRPNHNHGSADSVTRQSAPTEYPGTECARPLGFCSRLRQQPRADGPERDLICDRCRCHRASCRRPLRRLLAHDQACGGVALWFHGATYSTSASASVRSRKYLLRKAGVLRSTFRPRISESSLSRPKNSKPGTKAGSNSTSTSTSLPGWKSSRRTDPNSASLRM